MTTTKALIGAYFFIKKGTFYFSLEDIILSAKSGIAAGIPLGFGSWVLTKIRTNKNEQ